MTTRRKQKYFCAALGTIKRELLKLAPTDNRHLQLSINQVIINQLIKSNIGRYGNFTDYACGYFIVTDNYA